MPLTVLPDSDIEFYVLVDLQDSNSYFVIDLTRCLLITSTNRIDLVDVQLLFLCSASEDEGYAVRSTSFVPLWLTVQEDEEA